MRDFSVSAIAFVPCLHDTPSCVAERCLWLKYQENQPNINFASSCEIFLVIHIGYCRMFLLTEKIHDSASLRKFIVFLKWSKTAGTHPHVNLNNPAMVSGRLGSALLPEFVSLDLLWFLWFSSSTTLQPFELVFLLLRDVLSNSWLHTASGRVSAGQWNAQCLITVEILELEALGVLQGLSLAAQRICDTSWCSRTREGS